MKIKVTDFAWGMSAEELVARSTDRDRYPHDCNRCNMPAYNCFTGGQECSNSKCINYVAPAESIDQIDEEIDMEYNGDGDTLVMDASTWVAGDLWWP